jgi:hypothetical protein
MHSRRTNYRGQHGPHWMCRAALLLTSIFELSLNVLRNTVVCIVSRRVAVMNKPTESQQSKERSLIMKPTERLNFKLSMLKFKTRGLCFQKMLNTGLRGDESCVQKRAYMHTYAAHD